MALSTAPSSWSRAGLNHSSHGGLLCHRPALAVEPAVGQRSAYYHRPQHQEWGSSSSSVLALAVAMTIHHTHDSNHSPAIPGFWVPRCHHLCTLCTRTWGPQLRCMAWLRPMATTLGILAWFRGWQEPTECRLMATMLVLRRWVLLVAAIQWRLWHGGYFLVCQWTWNYVIYTIWPFIICPVFVFDFLALKWAYFKNFNC